jgi:hypothetical protein
MKTKTVIYFFALLLGINSCIMDTVMITERPGRTVLAYMVASNLGSALNNNIDDMIYAATAKNLNGGHLIVFYSLNQTAAELFEIKEGTGGVVTRHHIRDYENMSAVLPATMQQVIREVAELYPSDHYGMILASHGSSWLPGNYNNLLRAFGEESGHKMEIYELAQGLPEEIRFDFLLFDACSMASVECVYELREKTDYIIASPSETMSYGFPYKTMLSCLFTENADLQKAAENFYLFYLNDYAFPYGTISVTKTSELEALASITREIIAGAGEENTIWSAPFPDWQVLAYWRYAPTKLYDFEDVTGRLATAEQRTRLNACIKKAVTSAYATDGAYSTEGYMPIAVERFSGLAVYPLQKHLPQLNDWYTRLEWYKAVYLNEASSIKN